MCEPDCYRDRFNVLIFSRCINEDKLKKISALQTLDRKHDWRRYVKLTNIFWKIK
jgi:hypothetical protein